MKSIEWCVERQVTFHFSDETRGISSLSRCCSFKPRTRLHTLAMLRCSRVGSCPLRGVGIAHPFIIDLKTTLVNEEPDTANN